MSPDADNRPVRQAARALVVDPDERILLVCFPTADGNYWATPGGGLEPGESMLEGLRRELSEELGRTDLEIGPLIWTRTSWFAVSEQYSGQYNEIYLVRSPHFTPEPQIGWDAMADEGVSEIRWWTLDEIESAASDTQRFVPTDIAALTREVLDHGPDPTVRSINATSFGTAAAAYEAGRPSYPPEAVAWLTSGLASGSQIVDVGAGTGKLTRQLVALGFATTAVDPDPKMLTQLRHASPDVATVVSTAERLDLPDRSMDAAMFGQAWHWVDVAAASGELGRVVRPGGVLGLIWNVRDERVDWVAELNEIIHRSAAEQMISTDDVKVGSPFGPLDRFSADWSTPMTRTDVESMVQSWSDYLIANPREQQRINEGLGELLDRLELGGERTIDFPYVVHAYRARRA